MQELRFAKEAIDVTEPGKISMPEGHLHPMTQTYREIRDALVGMGFTTYEGPEVEYDDYNFTKLNLPLDHPARDMQDTFYVNDKVVLRKYEPSCIFCASSRNLVVYQEKNVCRSCIEKLNKA